MGEFVVLDHWMTIGRSSKKSSFISPKGRIQTGEKGIGRFALDRIADKCQMLTGTGESNNKLLWTVNWNSFAPGKNITEIGAELNETTLDFTEFVHDCTNNYVVKLIKDEYIRID